MNDAMPSHNIAARHIEFEMLEKRLHAVFPAEQSYTATT